MCIIVTPIGVLYIFFLNMSPSGPVFFATLLSIVSREVFIRGILRSNVTKYRFTMRVKYLLRSV